MQRLHKRLNRYLFNCQLKPITIEINDINNHPNNGYAFAEYCRYLDGASESKITFASETIDYLAQQKNQKDQVYLITMLLLHEMIHQYCAEKDIADHNHNESWQHVAIEHGLHSIYKDGVIQAEDLDLITLIVISKVRIY